MRKRNGVVAGSRESLETNKCSFLCVQKLCRTYVLQVGPTIRSAVMRCLHF
jgi:hypothetical protein